MNKRITIAQEEYFQEDKYFDCLYPLRIQSLSQRHWTPLRIAKEAAQFLGQKAGDRILDIGSGVGKFCIAAAYYVPHAHFAGVEQRGYLIDYAEDARKYLGINNASFVPGNFLQINLQDFNHFYFYNSFFENLDDADRIDDNIRYSEALYERYVSYLRNMLSLVPQGTRLATYHSFTEEVPREFKLLKCLENNNLLFWEKK